MPITDHIQRQALARNIASRLAKLTAAGDELLVIERLVECLERGLGPYGPLDLANDKRCFRHERLMERLDACIYDVCDELVLEHRARSGVQDALVDEVLREWDPVEQRTKISDAPARIAQLDAATKAESRAVPVAMEDLESQPYAAVRVVEP